MKVVAIIMTYNEKENVGPMMDAWLKIAKENPKYQFEVLIVDANSPDGTGEIVKKYHQQHENIKLLSGPRMGYGKDLVKGYKYAMEEMKADVLVPIDADFQWDPFLTPKLLKKIDEGYDVVVASRGVPGGKDDFGLFRKLTHWLSDTILAYYWAGIKEVKDHAGAFKAIRVKGVLDQVQLEKLDVVGFVVQMKTIYELSKTKAKFFEIPAIYGQRKAGQPTTVGLKSLPRFLKYVFEYALIATKIRIERSQKFIKFGVVGFVGYVINASTLYLFANMLAFPEWLAWALSTELAIISNFTWNNLWTFKEKKIKGVKNIASKFIQFNGTSIGALLIQTTVGTLGVRLLGPSFRQILLPFIIFFLVIPYNYTMYNVFIWRTWKLPFLSKLQKKA
jgi:dolichol-phosphate mannosyltransferase